MEILLVFANSFVISWSLCSLSNWCSYDLFIILLFIHNQSLVCFFQISLWAMLPTNRLRWYIMPALRINFLKLNSLSIVSPIWISWFDILNILILLWFFRFILVISISLLVDHPITSTAYIMYSTLIIGIKCTYNRWIKWS